jgi:hypothetical protein
MDGGNQPIFEDRFVEMRITRRRLLKTTGAAGAVALATSATAQTLRRPGAAPGSAAAPGAIGSWMLTETSGSRPMPAGSPFRFSLGLNQGDVPSGASISLKDGAGNALAVQVDAIIYWPDGSLRWCEIRGYTPRAMGAHSRDAISVYRNAGG